jgi:hypothetical protein
MILQTGGVHVGRNLDEIHAGFHGHLDRGDRLDIAVIQACLIDQLDFVVADFVIGARPVFGRCGRGSVGTANGCLSDVVASGSQSAGISSGRQARCEANAESRRSRGNSAEETTPAS